MDSIPTPFASSLPLGDDEEGAVELGLYGSRLEARTLKEMAVALRELRKQQVEEDPGGDAHMSVEGDVV